MRRAVLGLAILGMLTGSMGLGLASLPEPAASTVQAGCGAEIPSLERVQAALAGLGMEPVTDTSALPLLATADEPGLEAGASLPIDQGTLGACQGEIRPGVQLTINDAFLCTLNWVFRDRVGAYYVGTAGHCAPGGNPKYSVAGVAADIGSTAFTTGNGGVGNDFAIIRIDPAYYSKINPTLCHFGGAQGVWTTGGTQVLMHYGYGLVYGLTEPTRHRFAVLDGSTWNANSFTFAGLVAGGDSGSPIMVFDTATSNGYAVGVITHSSLPLISAGAAFASRLDKHINQANAATGLGITLVTSATQPNPIGDGL